MLSEATELTARIGRITARITHSETCLLSQACASTKLLALHMVGTACSSRMAPYGLPFPEGVRNRVVTANVQPMVDTAYVP